MPNVDRREFLRLVGAGGVGAGAGFMLAESIKHPVEHLIPYPVPPEEFSPGIATWYNSVCGMCPAGCGISVRTREGRAKKIEGNPSHPVNQGRLCALGQAGLQALYNPDRITGPLLQAGSKGDGSFVPTTWNDGLTRVATELREARGGDAVVLLSQGVRGQLAALFELFMAELGSGALLHYDFAHPHALHAANEKLFGEQQLPYYDIANSRYLLSFGADYLNHWLSPVHYALGFGHSRQGGDGPRGKFVQIEPRMSMSGAAADEWIPAKPGTEGVLALGIAHGIVASGRYAGDDVGSWTTALAAYGPEHVAGETGVPAKTIARLVHDFAHGQPGLAIGGSNHSNGVETLVAINALNYLVGNIGKKGGVVFNPEPPLPHSKNRQANYVEMRALVERARQGGVDVLIVNNTNPVFTLPEVAGFREALGSIPLVVSLSCFMDETTSLADVILPSHTYLESWGDDAPQPGVGFPVAAVSQPVVAPLYNTRATGDIVIGLAEKLGLGDVFPCKSIEDCVRDNWRQRLADGASEGADVDVLWRDVLRSGAWGKNTRREHAVAFDPRAIGSVAVQRPGFAGSAGDYAFLLQPYLSSALYDGRGANLPWMQELPDPMTSVVYGTWLEMNPQTAAQLGLSDGDLVSVASEYGSIEAPLVVFPAIMPDVVAMPIGQGHEQLGRYSRNRGSNPIRILAPMLDASGALATAATRVKVTATGRRAPAVKTGGESRQLGRNIVQTVGGSGSDSHDSPGHSTKLNSIPITVEPA